MLLTVSGDGASVGAADGVLFAYLSNPMSNAIYRRIGCEPVCDSVRIDFRVP